MTNESEIETMLRASLGLLPVDQEHAVSRYGGLHQELSHAIIGAAIEVHRHLGPGQLESLYQHAFEHELGLRAIRSQGQVPVSMTYKGVGVGDLVVDLIVEDKVIVELKSVASLQPVHFAQTLSYMRATELKLGLLINFNVPVLCRGVRRVIR
jgi:GxxExxY protein